MAIAVNATKQVLADAYKTLAGSANVYVSLHTSDPGSTGANELSGGSYARVQGTWTSGTTGTLSMPELTFNSPAATITHVGLWSASTAGTFYDKAALVPNITLSGAGTVKVTPSFTQS
ncbi:phage tail fiber protein [Nocardia wallacei]|uniref:phage tail fiber protein n=1 Tax=Nocardia wallacei TaxID=480035 RepID=UPI002453C619|nr:hypothetical protein [Nocardia wallacei]